jgi:hypothetical protein
MLEHSPRNPGAAAMSESAASARSAGGYVVLREVTAGHWVVVGEAARRPGLPARKARRQAVDDATGGAAGADETYAVLPRSEWQTAQQF